VRIGIVTDFYYPWIGGPSTVIQNVGNGLASRGHSVFLLAPSPDGKPRSEIDGGMSVTRASTSRVPFGFNLRSALWPKDEVESWMVHAAPDVVHIHHPFPLSCTSASAALKRGIPLAATNHTIPECSLWGVRKVPLVYQASEAAFGFWILRLLNRCQSVATPTETAAHALRVMGYSRPIRAISNGVDTERFSPRPAAENLRSRFGLDARPVVLYTGRLDAEKELDVWLRAAAIVRETADVQFLIGGQGTERRRLEELVRSLGMDGVVRFTGHVSASDFADVYSLAQVYCITSRVELQSIATLEALASGLPAVGVSARALPELIHEGKNGLLAPPGDSPAIATALLAILGDDQERARMGMHSRDIALHHGLDETVEAYEDFLQAVANQA
jgi:1,2-diacylglycerol 3-alpha-glucosyltransferase